MSVLDRVDPKLLKQIPNLPEHEQREILALIEELEEAEGKSKPVKGLCRLLSVYGLLLLKGVIIRLWAMLLSELPVVS